MADIDIDATLAGESSQTADVTVLFSLDGALAGASSVGSTLNALLVLDASLAGGASLVAGLKASLALQAALAGTSSLSDTPSETHFITAVITGASLVTADMTWKTHPGAPTPRPSINGGATLQQFIDATGSSRTATRTPMASHTVVELNPIRKPFTPR